MLHSQKRQGVGTISSPYQLEPDSFFLKENGSGIIIFRNHFTFFVTSLFLLSFISVASKYFLTNLGVKAWNRPSTSPHINI